MLTGIQARAIRFKLGFTQKELAEYLGVPQGTWSQVETGKVKLQSYMEVRFINLLTDLGEIEEASQLYSYLSNLTADDMESVKKKWLHAPHQEEDEQSEEEETKEEEEEESEVEEVVKKFVDMVNHPPHYADRQFEVIDVIKDSLTDEGYRGFLEGTIIRYILRFKVKENALQDLEKAEWYLKRLIKEYKETGEE